MFRWSIGLAGAFALAGPMSVMAKPIAFADGYTVMAEYGAGTMKEAQLFYAPRYDFSVGGGHVELDSDETAKSRHINYARLMLSEHKPLVFGSAAALLAVSGIALWYGRKLPCPTDPDAALASFALGIVFAFVLPAPS
jgi:hypothetical protein